MTTFAGRASVVDNVHGASMPGAAAVDEPQTGSGHQPASGVDPIYSITPGTGRLRCDNATDIDRNMVVAMHLSPIVAFILSPLVLVVPFIVWAMRKDQSPLADDHGHELMNFAISFTLLHVICAITLIGFLAMPVLWVVGVIALIRATIAGSRGEFFRFPMTFRFIS